MSFDFYTNKEKSKQWLEQAGFTGIKIWTQPVNMMIKSGEEYMSKYGNGPFIQKAKSYGFPDDKVEEMRLEAIDEFNKALGEQFSSMTFQAAVFVAYK